MPPVTPPDRRRPSPPAAGIPSKPPAGERLSGPVSGGRSSKPVPTVYLIVGEEEWLAEAALRKLLDDLLPMEERNLNLDVVDAGETPVQDIVMRCETLPFFGSRRAVVVRRGEHLNAADQDALAAYLARGAPPSVLVIVAEKMDRRRQLFAVLQRTGRIIPCEPLDPGALPGWIRAKVQEAGKTIPAEAAQTLVVLVGGSLRELASEIGKLVSYVGDRGIITSEDVRAVASHVAEATVFELMDALGHRRADQALRLLQTVLAEEPPVKVLFMLGDQIRMLLKTKALLGRYAAPGRRLPQAAIREALGTRAFLFGRYKAQVEAFGRLDVSRVLGLLMETDTEIKTGQKPPRLALETLIVGLCV